MRRFMIGLAIALAMSAATLNGQATVTQKPTEVVAPQAREKAKNLIEDVTTVGCIRLWRPAPDDPKQMPPDRQPGIAGIYLLTPLASNPAAATIDMPTYVLTPSATLNFSQHVDRKVEITGTSQAAPMPPTVQELVTVPQRPENKPSVQSMPRLTVRTMKMVSESCP